MDQLNAFLKIAKRHYFWFLTVVVVGAGLGTWFVASGKLRAEYEDNRSKIESTKQQIQGIAGETNHPNDQSKREMDLRIKDLKKEVGQVWKTLYEHQRLNTLVWPTDIRDDFIAAVKNLQPIEAKVQFPTPVEEELSQTFKERYRDYIKAELPKLAETIGSTWAPSATGVGGSPGEPGRFGAPPLIGGGEFGRQPVNPEDELLVLWDPANQTQLQNERFDWSKKPGKVPSTLDVLYTQEDLWVLQTIMGIIKNTNGTATAHHRATVKEIESIHLGRDALGLVGKVQRLQSTQAAGDFFGGQYAQPTDPVISTPYERPGEGGGIAADPADRRYVDQDNQPIPAETLRGALLTNSPETASLSVAKRLPIRIRVKMDQRKIHELLAECGSAPLTIEVRQVRVNREPGAASSGSFGGGEFGRSIEPSYGRSGGATPDPSTTYDVPVEVYGVVYIFNPPNQSILEISEDQKAQAAATVNPPVDVPVAEPVPTDPVPAEPVPAEPVPGEPAPVAPAPVAPVEPAPVAPAPEPNPTEPAPVAPAGN